MVAYYLAAVTFTEADASTSLLTKMQRRQLMGRAGLGRFENVTDLGHFVRYRQPCDVALVQAGCQTQIVRTLHDQRFAGYFGRGLSDRA